MGFNYHSPKSFDYHQMEKNNSTKISNILTTMLSNPDIPTNLIGDQVLKNIKKYFKTYP